MWYTNEIKGYLLNNAVNATDFILNRGKDYSNSEFTDDLAVEFFGYARPMIIVINSIKYNLDCMTTLNDANIIKNAIKTDSIEYIAETSNDIDNIVGYIDDFILEYNIDNSDYLAPSRYYNAVEQRGYSVVVSEILKELNE